MTIRLLKLTFPALLAKMLRFVPMKVTKRKETGTRHDPEHLVSEEEKEFGMRKERREDVRGEKAFWRVLCHLTALRWPHLNAAPPLAVVVD
jgi:hypothetical protein